MRLAERKDRRSGATTLQVTAGRRETLEYAQAEWLRGAPDRCLLPFDYDSAGAEARFYYDVTGMERLDPRQSYIFMMNHQSWFDIFTVYGWLPYFFKWIMKADLRRIPFVGRACESAGHIFINRESPKAAQRSLEKAKSVLRHGVSVVIFPEGTRSRDGRLGRFKRGGFKIATDLGLPVVPVTLRGCFERMPRGTFAVKPGRIDMVVHAPIDVSAHSADTIPDVRGMGAKDAVYLLEKLGLDVRIQGRGRVVTQSVLHGTPATRGRKITLVLR